MPQGWICSWTTQSFLDEKYIVNRDNLPKKVGADPLTEYVNMIPGSCNFRDAHKWPLPASWHVGIKHKSPWKGLLPWAFIRSAIGTIGGVWVLPVSSLLVLAILMKPPTISSSTR
jgi:hypothetical protein